jgi:hypothetical protein
MALVDCALLEYQGADRLKCPVADIYKKLKSYKPEDGQVSTQSISSKALKT